VYGRTSTVTMLIKAGADVNYQDSKVFRYLLRSQHESQLFGYG
jgi:hypothetical protein